MDYNLSGVIRGHKLISFSQSVEAWSLVGTWSAVVGPKADGTYDLTQFQPGSAIDFEHAKKCLITGWSRGDDGQILLQGNNAGGWLFRTLGSVQSLPDGGSLQLIRNLAGRAGISVGGGGGLTGFNAKSLVTASTVAEAIVELAQMSGVVLYIDNDGNIQLTAPSIRAINFQNVLSDGGRSLDLDGYATGVTVIVYRRKETKEEKAGGKPGEEPKGPFIKGKTPSGTITEVTTSGNGYSFTVLEPIGQIKAVSGSYLSTDNLITTTFNESYDYNINTGTRWEGNREVRWFRWVLQGYTRSKIVEGSFVTSDGRNLPFREETTEQYALQWSWIGSVKEKEQILKTTARTPAILEGMPESPPYDMFSETTYKRDFDRLIIEKRETSYEKMEIGRLSRVELLENPGTYMTDARGRPLMIKGNSSTEWVERVKTSITIENIGKDGTICFRTSESSDDEGREWIIKNGAYLYQPLDLEDDAQKKARELAEAYAVFSERGSEFSTDVSPGGLPSDIAYDELILEGAERYWHQVSENGVPIDSENWYNAATGGYVPSAVCPHYEALKCRIWEIPTVWEHTTEDCPYRGQRWTDCPRALAALEQAKAEDDVQEFEPPVTCTAGVVTSGAHHVRKIYITDFISEIAARSIGTTIAQNLLKIKGARGIRQTVTIPFDTTLHPDGTIVSVGHDYKSMKTTVSYRLDEAVPDILLPASMVSVSYLVGERERNRNMRSVIGEVIEIDKATARITVLAEDTILSCSSKLKWLAVGDQVVVDLPAGNSLNGTVVARA